MLPERSVSWDGLDRRERPETRDPLEQLVLRGQPDCLGQQALPERLGAPEQLEQLDPKEQPVEPAVQELPEQREPPDHWDCPDRSATPALRVRSVQRDQLEKGATREFPDQLA